MRRSSEFEVYRCQNIFIETLTTASKFEGKNRSCSEDINKIKTDPHWVTALVHYKHL